MPQASFTGHVMLYASVMLSEVLFCLICLLRHYTTAIFVERFLLNVNNPHDVPSLGYFQIVFWRPECYIVFHKGDPPEAKHDVDRLCAFELPPGYKLDR